MSLASSKDFSLYLFFLIFSLLKTFLADDKSSVDFGCLKNSLSLLFGTSLLEKSFSLLKDFCLLSKYFLDKLCFLALEKFLSAFSDFISSFTFAIFLNPFICLPLLSFQKCFYWYLAYILNFGYLLIFLCKFHLLIDFLFLYDI